MKSTLQENIRLEVGGTLLVPRRKTINDTLHFDLIFGHSELALNSGLPRSRGTLIFLSSIQLPLPAQKNRAGCYMAGMSGNEARIRKRRMWIGNVETA